MTFYVRSWINYHNALFVDDALSACKDYINNQDSHKQYWMWIEDENDKVIYEKHKDCSGKIPAEEESSKTEKPKKTYKKKLEKIIHKDLEHIDALSRAILDCKHMYYCEGKPLLSDFEFDKLEEELKALDPDNKALGVGCILCGEKSEVVLSDSAAGSET